jgi:hypothetical protein
MEGQPLALSGGIVGSNAGGSFMAKGGTFLEVFDGNTGTHMDVKQSGDNGGFAGIVLDTAAVVRCVQVMPRRDLADRLIGAVIQGMQPGAKGWAGARVLHTISCADYPAENEWLAISIPKSLQGPYIALRYVGALGANMNVAEVRFLPSACPSCPKKKEQRIGADVEPPHAIRVVCAPSDWICSSGLARRITAKLTSDSGVPFSFARNGAPSHCLGDKPRIYFSGYPGGFPRSCDLRVFINSESTSTFAGDLTISGVRDLPSKMKASENTAVVYLPYLFFAVLQGGETDDHALVANGASQPQVGSRLFAAYATSHCGVEARDRIYTMLSEYKPLHYLNKECGKGSTPAPNGTMDDRADETSWVDAVTRRFSHFKFAVVFENTIEPGYHTEKLALARKAGAVPVYYGSRHIHTLFNSSSFIDCSPQPRESMEAAFQRCKEQVIAVDKDDNKWREMVAAPFLRDNKPLNYGPLARLLRAMVCSKTKHCPADREGALETACPVLRGKVPPLRGHVFGNNAGGVWGNDGYEAVFDGDESTFMDVKTERTIIEHVGAVAARFSQAVGTALGLAEGAEEGAVGAVDSATPRHIHLTCFAGIRLRRPAVVASVSFVPRPWPHVSRMVGGKFQGSLDHDLTSTTVFTDMYTIKKMDIMGPLHEGHMGAFHVSVPVGKRGPFWLLRYVPPRESQGNVAEIQFFGAINASAAVAALQSAPSIADQFFVPKAKGCRSSKGYERVLVSYAGGSEKYFGFQRHGCDHALNWGVDRCVLCNKSSIDAEYVARNEHLWDYKIGAGLWNWKAVCIMQALETMREGDIALYMDAGSHLLQNPEPLFERAERDDIAFFSDYPHTVGQYVSRGALALLGGERWRSCPMVNGSPHFWKKSLRTRLVLSQWLTYSQDARIGSGVGDPRLKLDPFAEYVDHRHDMAALSILAYRWKIAVWRPPQIYGMVESVWKAYPNSSDYGNVVREM